MAVVTAKEIADLREAASQGNKFAAEKLAEYKIGIAANTPATVIESMMDAAKRGNATAKEGLRNLGINPPRTAVHGVSGPKPKFRASGAARSAAAEAFVSPEAIGAGTRVATGVTPMAVDAAMTPAATAAGPKAAASTMASTVAEVTAAPKWTASEAWAKEFTGTGFPTTASKMRKLLTSIFGKSKVDNSILESMVAEFRGISLEARTGVEASKFIKDFGSKLAVTAGEVPAASGVMGVVNKLLGINKTGANVAMSEAAGMPIASKVLGGIGKVGNLAMLALLAKQLVVDPVNRDIAAAKDATLDSAGQERMAQDAANAEIINVLKQRRLMQDAGGGDSGIINAMAKMQLTNAGMGGSRTPGAIQI